MSSDVAGCLAVSRGSTTLAIARWPPSSNHTALLRSRKLFQDPLGLRCPCSPGAPRRRALDGNAARARIRPWESWIDFHVMAASVAGSAHPLGSDKRAPGHAVTVCILKNRFATFRSFHQVCIPLPYKYPDPVLNWSAHLLTATLRPVSHPTTVQQPPPPSSRELPFCTKLTLLEALAHLYPSVAAWVFL